MINIFFGPLSQFELLETNPSCCYDVTAIVFGMTELDKTAFWISIMLGVWFVNEFYAEDSEDSVINFDDELLVTDLVSHSNYNYSDLVTTFFSLIFSANFSGLLPYSQTLTSQMVVALALSLVTMFLVWIHAGINNKLSTLNHFLPNGSPLVITSFIIIIELISNISRIISLAVRLFANMTSGHALLKILASFGIGAATLVGGWALLSLFPILIIFIITIIEILIAFLQTYVFVTLLLIYVSEQE